MTVLLAPQILLTITLLVSGIAKLPNARATEDAMRSLRLPAVGMHPLAARAVPIAEIVLAARWWIPLRFIQVPVAVIVLALMAAYLVIIARALRFDAPVTCSCFGTLGSPTVSRATLARNITLTLLAMLALLFAWTGAAGHYIAEYWWYAFLLALALGVAVLLTGFAMSGSTPAAAPEHARPMQTPAPTPAPAAPHTVHEQDGQPDDALDGEVVGEDGLLDYERTPTPFGVIVGPDGAPETLRQATQSTAALLLWVSPGCGPCERIIDALPRWREQLEPLVAVRPLLLMSTDHLSEANAARLGAGVAHDLDLNVARATGAHGAPAAVLLGADGMLAGGPVSGLEVDEFVEEIIESLREAREAGELAGPEDEAS